MPSRTKNRRTSTSGRRSGGLLWLSIGMILGGIAVGVFFVKLVVPRTLESSPLVDQQAQSSVAAGSVKPRFDFYTMLPEMEVAVAPEPTVAPIYKPQQATPAQSQLAESLAVLQPNNAAKPHNQINDKTPTTLPTTPLAKIEPQPAKPAEKPAVVEGYMLQLASFKNFTDADQLKAKLSLSGFQVSIQTISGSNGEQWFRVRTGPYNQLSAAERDREALKQQHINSILLKIRG